MHKPSKNELYQYRNLIHNKFSEIFFSKNDAFFSNHDHASISTTHLNTYVTPQPREQIFYQEYPMEKKGKKFGTSEIRLFMCIQETQELLQVDKNRNAKRLPDPTAFKIQTKQSLHDSNQMEWNSKIQQAYLRIKLTFKERSEVCVYFEKEQNCMEIACFIKALILKSNKKASVFTKCFGIYGNVLGRSFSEIIVIYRNEVGRRKEMKRQEKALKSLQLLYNDGIFKRKLIEEWRNLTFSSVKGQREKNYQIRKIKVVKVEASQKIRASNMKLRILVGEYGKRNQIEALVDQKQRLLAEINLIEGSRTNMNQSGMQMAVDGAEYFTKEQEGSQSLNESVKVRSKQPLRVQLCTELTYRASFTIFDLQYHYHSNVGADQAGKGRIRKVQLSLSPFETDGSLRQCKIQQILKNPFLDKIQSERLGTVNQQFEASIEQKISQSQSQNLIKPSAQTQPSLIVHFEIYYSSNTQKTSFQKPINNQFPTFQKAVPENYPIINSIQPDTNYFSHHFIPFLNNLTFNAINMNPSDTEHSEPSIELIPVVNDQRAVQPVPKTVQKYLLKYLHYTERCYPVEISFNCVHKLTQNLKTTQIIQKFLLSPTFISFKDQPFQATLIYQLLVEKSSHLKFYDVQKLVLEYQAPELRRLLNTIKVFDENPRINFTSPLLKLTRRALQIVKNQTNSSAFMIGTSFSKDFEFSTLTGIESCAFFIILGFIKQFSSFFIYQKDVWKRNLHWNTLLFKMVLKKEFPVIHHKCLSLQLNVEALFGIEFCSVFSEYFSDNLWTELTIKANSQKNKDSQVQNVMVSAFIALLQLTIMNRKEEIFTGQSLMVYLKEKSRTIECCKDFYLSVSKMNNLVEFYREGEYQGILKELYEIYESSSLNEDKMSFGVLAQAVYKQFLHCKLKQSTQKELSPKGNSDQTQRKIFITIDKLNLSESFNVRKVLIQVFQAKHSLYSHEFKNIDIDTFSVSIEIVPKTTQNIFFYIKTKQKPYYYTLDLNTTASNYYHHLTKPLSTSLKLSPVPEDGSFISLQLFIKDQTPIEHFEKIVPQKYCQSLLFDQSISDLIIDANKYLRNFRMTQKNFNLLYAKLGWYANHYLIPHDRLLSIFFTSHSALSPQINVNREQDKIYTLNSYTRTLFGKAVVPKPKSFPSQNCIIDTVKHRIRSISCIGSKNITLNSKSLTPDQHKTTQNLLCYTLENFDIDSVGSFFQFYTKMTELPLIDHLTYDPMTFYILPTIEFECSYINQAQGVKLKFLVCLSESPDQRKEGELWEKLVTDFSQTQINQIEQIMLELEEHYFGNDDFEECDGFKSMEFINSKGSRLGMSSSNIQMKSFYSSFPKAVNFSHLDSNISIDQFGLILKFNILLSIVKKLSKTCNKKQFHLKDHMNQRLGEAKLFSEKFNYAIKLSQNDYLLPNTHYCQLFRYMIEAPKQVRVDIQLRKQRNLLSQQKLSSGNFWLIQSQSKTLGQNDIAHQQLMDKQRKVSFNKLKKYEDWGMIYGQWRRVEVLGKQNVSSENVDVSNLAMSKSDHFKAEKQKQGESIMQIGLMVEDVETYVVEEMQSRKLYRMKSESIIWKSEKSKSKFIGQNHQNLVFLDNKSV